MIGATQDRNYVLLSRASIRRIPVSRPAAVAAALVVGYCVLATVVMSGLLWAAYADAVRSHGAPGRILLWVAAAAVVLWTILPRPDRFEPPGPRIPADDEPALFAVLQEVARSTGEKVPADVYLVNDVTASVTSRGGIMGVGGRRVMLLGLPLMQSLGIQKFKAILAHEFGHYRGGEVPLGPWIHKTRGAIGRMLQAHRRLPHSGATGFGRVFLRATHDVSRCQELVADEVGACAAGGAAMISALEAVQATSVAYRIYMQQELQPVVERGYLPPVGAGFARFLDAPGMDVYLGAVVQCEAAQGGTDPFDTHPSLNDRIAALKNHPAGSLNDTRRASSLLTDVVRWERLLFRTSLATEDLEPLEWHQVVDAVYMPLWRARVDSQGHLLRSCTIGTLPTTSVEFIELGSMLSSGRDAAVTDRVRLDRAGQLILAAITVRLAALGWSVEALPGQETILRLNGQELRPYSELRAVLDGRVPAGWWRERCAELGIAEVPLWGGRHPGTKREER